MWERWNGDQMRDDPSMNSYNHYAYGAVADWIYRYAAGIDALPSDAGFHTIYLHPTFDARLGSLDVRYQSSYGEIRSSWSMKGTDVAWLVTVPANTTARLPLQPGQKDKFTLDGETLGSSKKLGLVSTSDGSITYELPAGTYSFKVTVQVGAQLLVVRSERVIDIPEVCVRNYYPIATRQIITLPSQEQDDYGTRHGRRDLEGAGFALK